MSFREKSAWVSLFASLAVYSWYFATYAAALAAGHAARGPFLGRLFASFILLVLLQIALHVAITIRTPRDANAPADERERLIALKAIRIAYAVLASGVMLTVGAMWAATESFFVLNMLFFFLVLATVARYAAEIVQYRHGT